MAKFKRVDYQQAYAIKAYASATEDLKLVVGNIISHNAGTDQVALLSDAAAAVTAKNNGLEIYIISQADAVTYKTGTSYKSYAIDNTVVVPSNSASKGLVVGYRVDNLDNIEW